MEEEEKSDQDAKSVLQYLNVCVCVYMWVSRKRYRRRSKDVIQVCNADSPFIDHLIAHPLVPLISFAILSLSYEFNKSYKIMSHLVTPYISVLSLSKSESESESESKVE